MCTCVFNAMYVYLAVFLVPTTSLPVANAGGVGGFTLLFFGPPRTNLDRFGQDSLAMPIRG